MKIALGIPLFVALAILASLSNSQDSPVSRKMKEIEDKRSTTRFIVGSNMRLKPGDFLPKPENLFYLKLSERQPTLVLLLGNFFELSDYDKEEMLVKELYEKLHKHYRESFSNYASYSQNFNTLVLPGPSDFYPALKYHSSSATIVTSFRIAYNIPMVPLSKFTSESHLSQIMKIKANYDNAKQQYSRSIGVLGLDVVSELKRDSPNILIESLKDEGVLKEKYRVPNGLFEELEEMLGSKMFDLVILTSSIPVLPEKRGVIHEGWSKKDKEKLLSTLKKFPSVNGT